MSPIIKPIWASSIWAYYKPDQFSYQVQAFINVRIPVIYIIEEACKLALGSSSFFKVIISIDLLSLNQLFRYSSFPAYDQIKYRTEEGHEQHDQQPDELIIIPEPVL